jgi:hypothetical protein
MSGTKTHPFRHLRFRIPLVTGTTMPIYYAYEGSR